MVRTSTALVAAMLIAAPAGAQTSNQQLEAVRNLLRDTSAPSDDEAARRIATLQQDFNEFASEYLLQDPGRTSTPESSEPGGAARQASWRSRYLLVEADLTALLGPANAPAPTAGTPRLDPELRDRLQQIRTHLQTFYAATIQAREGNPVAHTGSTATGQGPAAPTTAAPQMPPPVRTSSDTRDAPVMPPSASAAPEPQRDPVAAPTVGIDPATALLLLDRIQAILDAATKGESPTSLAPVGTSGTVGAAGGKPAAAGGKVMLDRGLFDEIRAELTQIRALLKK